MTQMTLPLFFKCDGCRQITHESDKGNRIDVPGTKPVDICKRCWDEFRAGIPADGCTFVVDSVSSVTRE